MNRISGRIPKVRFAEYPVSGYSANLLSGTSLAGIMFYRENKIAYFLLFTGLKYEP